MTVADYSLVNLLTVLLGIAFLANGYYIVRSGREDLTVFLVSSAIGIGLILVAVTPTSVFGVIAKLLGIRLEAVAVLIVSNFVLFVVTTYLFSRIGRLKTNISKLNEEVSLLRQRVDDAIDDEER